MHKIVRGCNLEEGRIRKEVIFGSAIAAATHEVVMITVRIIESNLTVQYLRSLKPPKYRLILTKIPPYPLQI
jgi:hypothetical protein